MDIQAFLQTMWVWGPQNPVFWLFVLVGSVYVGTYLLLVGRLYGGSAVMPAFVTVRVAGMITIFELVTLLLVRSPARLELFFLALAYDYVRIFVPDDFLKLADGQINFVVLMVFFTTLVFFSVVHGMIQLVSVRRICGQWKLTAFVMLPTVVLLSFTLSFIISGSIYRLIA